MTADPTAAILMRELSTLADRAERRKQKYVAACTAATTLEELAGVQRLRIEDLEGWMRDICAAPTADACHRIAHMALWKRQTS